MKQRPGAPRTVPRQRQQGDYVEGEDVDGETGAAYSPQGGIADAQVVEGQGEQGEEERAEASSKHGPEAYNLLWQPRTGTSAADDCNDSREAREGD
jgi:hypothetical protein